MVKHLELSQGYSTTVDDQDFEQVAKYRWYATVIAGRPYATRPAPGNRNSKLYLHRELVKPAPGNLVDHIDGDSLNNCRNNLRECTRAQNNRNRRKKDPNDKSNYYGVTKNSNCSTWCARYKPQTGKTSYLGSFKTELEAAEAYNKAVIQDGDDYSPLNNLETQNEC